MSFHCAGQMLQKVNIPAKQMIWCLTVCLSVCLTTANVLALCMQDDAEGQHPSQADDLMFVSLPVCVSVCLTTAHVLALCRQDAAEG